MKASAGRARAKPKLPALTIHRYGGRLIYFWFGMRFRALMKLFKRGHYNFTLNCIPDVLLLLLWVPVELGALSHLGSEIPPRRRGASARAAAGLRHRPLAHRHDLPARSLLRVDPNLAYPTTYECFFPHHFLLTENTLPKVMKVLLPKKRPQDDVPVGFDRPQEEEFGMLMLGEGTPYVTHAWPRFGPADTEYLDFKGVSEAGKKKWADAYMWLYRRLALKHGDKPLVMKTPANAARLKLLTKLFPDARFIYLSRNPLKVFPSTVKLWRALYSTQGLHNPPNLDGWLDDYVLDMFARLTEDYEADRHVIPEGRLIELRYEDLIKDPIATLRDIYARLDIGDFSARRSADAGLSRRAEGAPRLRIRDAARAEAQSHRAPRALYRPLRLSRGGDAGAQQGPARARASGLLTCYSHLVIARHSDLALPARAQA